MFKNILIIGPGRAGKTTLARLIHQKYGYSVVRIDDIVTAMEAFPSLGISWDGDAAHIATQMAPFLRIYLKELSEGNAFYGGCKTVIEGTDVDFDALIPHINRRKYLIVGLTYDHVTDMGLFDAIRTHDTEDDWTYYLSDEQLRAYCAQYVEKNKHFGEKCKQYGIEVYDTSTDREAVLCDIVEHLEDKCHWEAPPDEA